LLLFKLTLNVYYQIRDTEREEIFPYLDEVVEYVDDAIKNNGKVFLHCIKGISRSATLIAAYLIKKQGKTTDEAIKILQNIRPIVDPNPYFRKQLKEYEQSLKDVSFIESESSLPDLVIDVEGELEEEQ